jgi:hypothetical protein
MEKDGQGSKEKGQDKKRLGNFRTHHERLSGRRSDRFRRERRALDDADFGRRAD